MGIRPKECHVKDAYIFCCWPEYDLIDWTLVASQYKILIVLFYYYSCINMIHSNGLCIYVQNWISSCNLMKGLHVIVGTCPNFFSFLHATFSLQFGLCSCVTRGWFLGDIFYRLCLSSSCMHFFLFLVILSAVIALSLVSNHLWLLFHHLVTVLLKGLLDGSCG